MYYPENLKKKKIIWERLTEIQKTEISEELTNVFGSPISITKIMHGGRLRIRLLPCTVEDCSF